MGEQARIGPGGIREIGWVNWGIVGLAGIAVGGDPPHIFSTLARNRRLFRRWLLFAAALMPGGRLPRRDTELLILRVAMTLNSLAVQPDHIAEHRPALLQRESGGRRRQATTEAKWPSRT